ncbi:odorant receptor 7a-like [Lucilia sericata]|uniref:odorant receptor 7a-like n=1 Tax=Lucilia sericata TaxID=13632 RepID=UPI0018A83E9C|nr:odorant receptor 7a-like [Lucilia sericata]
MSNINQKATREATETIFKILLYMGLQKPQKWKPLYYFYSLLINLSVCVLLPTSFMLSYFFEYHNMTTVQLLNSLQVSVNACCLPAKVLTMQISLKYLHRGMDIMDTLDKRCQRPDEKKKLSHCAIFGNRLSVFHATLYCFFAAVSVITSVIMGQAPYSMYIPNTDWKTSTMTFALQSFFEYVIMNAVCLHQVIVDSYSVVYIYVIRTHMQILVERVRSLGTDPKTSNDKHYEELLLCVKDHQELLRLVAVISPVISKTIFIQFLVTAAILGITLINNFIFADFSSQISCSLYFLVIMVQISPCCYQATFLLADSEQLSLAIFHCEWIDKDVRFRKMLIFFMMRSQNPITLKAMKLFPITLRTSLAIAKFSFSLYTVIKEMDFGKNLRQ